MMFSVIIPTYNRASLIVKTLQSVINQSFGDFEVIVVDDGSTDNTRQVVDSLNNDKIKYHYKKNEERSIARNYGAEHAKGNYLIFLDSDDRLAPDHLEQLHRYLSENAFKPEVVFPGMNVLNMDNSVAYSVKRKGILPPRKLVYGNVLGCSAMISAPLFRQHRFNTDPDLIVLEDWELWLRISCKTPIHCIPAGTLLVDNHEGRSVLNMDPSKVIRKIECLREKVLGNPCITQSTFWSKSRFLMGIYSYTSLHIALTGHHKKLAYKYLLLALSNDPGLIFKKRFYAIIRRLL